MRSCGWENRSKILKVEFKKGKEFAETLDREDPLKEYRKKFHIPQLSHRPCIYFVGNSLGLQPTHTADLVKAELQKWSTKGALAHLESENPWYSYHERVTDSLALLIGGEAREVVAMNSLTVNLHLMLTSFYRPTQDRYGILVEDGVFPSDRYAVASQMALHNQTLEKALFIWAPRPHQRILEISSLEEILNKHGEKIAVLLLGQVNYLTGQTFDIPKVVALARQKGCLVGLDLAHGIGNLKLQLHDWDVDFAIWCSYKYLNAGPGAIGGCFVHSKHLSKNLPKLAGWWGHDKMARFEMAPDFKPMPTVESWQLSNPPILQLAALRASLDIFDEVGMESLQKKTSLLTPYLEFLLKSQPCYGRDFSILTPLTHPHGCQISIAVGEKGEKVAEKLGEQGILADFRRPDILRVAPVPLYNTFSEVYEFAKTWESIWKDMIN